jgi:hypothetical protein
LGKGHILNPLLIIASQSRQQGPLPYEGNELARNPEGIHPSLHPGPDPGLRGRYHGSFKKIVIVVKMGAD